MNMPPDAFTISHYRDLIHPSRNPPKETEIARVPVLDDSDQSNIQRKATPKPRARHSDLPAVATDDQEGHGVSPVQPSTIPASITEQGTHDTKLLHISDDSWDDKPSYIGNRKSGQCYKRPRRRFSVRMKDHCERINAGDCEGSDGCYESGGTSDDFSDSDQGVKNAGLLSHKHKMRNFTSFAKGKFEQMLLECIVNTDDIPPNYQNIFIDPSVIEKVERVTALGLKRPMAYSHGVLKNNKVTGAILYGPPGTGKTLLARGVAKQSGFNMLSISTSEVWQKCHGDDEKMIKAIFSMARKMYPSIVFIDEADAMLGERKAGEKRHIRAMLNQFLMEWDGITSGPKSPFILLATNRPNDLDPAVLRRAPARILFPFPSNADRQGILRLLLEGEELKGISISTLAYMTPQYTGSDLKSLCVTAATECISEQRHDTDKRSLEHRHFMAAMQTIKATTLSKTREQDFNNFENNRHEQSGVEE